MLLLRRIKNSSQWADMLTDPTWGQPEDCPPSALWQLYEARKPDGALSVWRIKTDDDAENVAAAEYLQKGADEKGELQDLCYAEIAEEYLRVGNYSLVDKAASTPLQDINMKHVDIHSVTGRKFIEFARLVHRHGQMRTVSRKKIAARIAQRLVNGQLTLSSFSKVKTAPSILHAVWKADAVAFRVPQKPDIPFDEYLGLLLR